MTEQKENKELTFTYTSHHERHEHWLEMHKKGYRLKYSEILITATYREATKEELE